ncbi:cell division protease ftsH [Xylariaceae sp. FL0804]|nr:cell division protease ftsH [Xylariaceae sp. FL0804]
MALQTAALPSMAAAAATGLWPKASILALPLRLFSSSSKHGRAPEAVSRPLFDTRSSISPMHRTSLLASSPAAHRLQPRQMFIRPMSSFTSPASVFRASPTTSLPATMAVLQRRSFQLDRVSRNLLARMEESANRNPNSATAQNAFYQSLIRSNMPAIVVERYQSNRFATNPSATQAYYTALAMISPNSAVGAANEDITQTIGNLPGHLNDSQVKAVAQALAARSHGSTAAVEKGGVAKTTGAKEAPLHVVVDESTGGNVFKWVKFLLWFSLILYLSLVTVTLFIEGLSNFVKPQSALRKSNSQAKAEHQKARFSDVHGADEAKEELQEMVDFLKNPDKFSQLGGKLPKGILLVGPPGTGKTLLARAVAGEAGVPFFYMSGSEFDEVFVGVGAKRVRDLFADAKAKSPAIIFIDELDAIGGRRQAKDVAYVKQTLNQLLTEMDGFDQNSGVIIIGATNFPESLDKALVRPGRFDRHVTVDLPDVRGRLAILNYHAQKIKADKDVDLKAMAQSTSGLSGAELENIVNQAAVRASKLKAASVRKEDFDWAKDRVIMGAERKSMVITEKEKEMTAYHEAGHALVSLYTAGTSGSKLYKVTVLPRGPSLGHTSMLPEMDKYSYTVDNFLARIDVALGGKLAEELVYGVNQVTSGASSDLKNATQTAFNMVARLGMSANLGNMEYGLLWDNLSSQTKSRVEVEVQRTLEESYERARQLLTKHRKELDLLAKALVQYETLDRDEVEKVIRGEPLPDRIAVPPGPMTVPGSTKAPGPEEALPTPPGSAGGSAAPPPTAPPISPKNLDS